MSEVEAFLERVNLFSGVHVVLFYCKHQTSRKSVADDNGCLLDRLQFSTGQSQEVIIKIFFKASLRVLYLDLNS